jgi:hypothetical protein
MLHRVQIFVEASIMLHLMVALVWARLPSQIHSVLVVCADCLENNWILWSSWGRSCYNHAIVFQADRGWYMDVTWSTIVVVDSRFQGFLLQSSHHMKDYHYEALRTKYWRVHSFACYSIQASDTFRSSS